MRSKPGINFVLLLLVTLSAGCAETKLDFCKYLSLEEARVFDRTISNAEMRQTEKILYCVYKNETSDRLFISLDRALKYPPKDFLKVLAKNSPEKYEKIISLSGPGVDSAALFLGNDNYNLRLEFLIAQNSGFSVTMRAHDVTSTSSEKIYKLKDIATRVLSRLSE